MLNILSTNYMVCHSAFTVYKCQCSKMHHYCLKIWFSHADSLFWNVLIFLLSNQKQTGKAKQQMAMPKMFPITIWWAPPGLWLDINYCLAIKRTIQATGFCPAFAYIGSWAKDFRPNCKIILKLQPVKFCTLIRSKVHCSNFRCYPLISFLAISLTLFTNMKDSVGFDKCSSQIIWHMIPQWCS